MLGKLWSTIKWTFTLGGTITETGDEQADFDAGEAVILDERLLASLNLDEDLMFFNQLIACRGQKKPMLLLVI